LVPAQIGPEGAAVIVTVGVTVGVIVTTTPADSKKHPLLLVTFTVYVPEVTGTNVLAVAALIGEPFRYHCHV
jgi:hypothetical protein